MKEHDELMNNTVVTTVMPYFGLYKAKNGCRIGGEQSGHIISLSMPVLVTAS